MTNKDMYLSFIVDQLRSGVYERKDVLSNFVANWQKSSRSFDRYWRKANDLYADEQRGIEEKKLEIHKEEQEAAIREGILDKTEALKILSKIAKSEFVDEKGNPPKFSDQKNAIELIAKVQGWLAPTKIEGTTQLISNIVRVEYGD